MHDLLGVLATAAPSSLGGVTLVDLRDQFYISSVTSELLLR